MINKRDITQELIRAWPGTAAPGLGEALFAWYVNIRDTGGLRLTTEGFRVLSQTLELEHWKLPIELKAITKRVLLDMDRKIAFPFYLDKRGKQIIFFSSREAMMATMYGDLTAWLNGSVVR
jgi:hypothetical protein